MEKIMRQAGIVKKRGNGLSYGLHLGGYFENYCVSGGQCLGDFMKRDSEGVVPRADYSHYPVGFAVQVGFFIEEENAASLQAARAHELVSCFGIVAGCDC